MLKAGLRCEVIDCSDPDVFTFLQELTSGFVMLAFSKVGCVIAKTSLDAGRYAAGDFLLHPPIVRTSSAANSHHVNPVHAAALHHSFLRPEVRPPSLLACSSVRRTGGLLLTATHGFNLGLLSVSKSGLVVGTAAEEHDDEKEDVKRVGMEPPGSGLSGLGAITGMRAECSLVMDLFCSVFGVENLIPCAKSC
ncbi:hypothetical protein B0T21DRAFT_346381 [Apiosordaria backusii]|uniref:Uncharacterized protein n=1 Tax=Apiosordaria backusii TaxID=314023 RepID=A0AA40BRC6_9PEZI|nr:hypothetical protein B0T21DRAFT_346381 [Apiosordaria backusii]